MKKLNLKRGPARLFQCSNCHRIHFEYGPIELELEINDFWKLSSIIKHKEKLRKKTHFYIVPIVHRNVNLKIHQDHYTSIKKVMVDGEKLLAAEYLLSTGELLEDASLENTYWWPQTKAMS